MKSARLLVQAALAGTLGKRAQEAAIAVVAKRTARTRLVKVSCPGCGYNAWTTKKWLGVGRPRCGTPDCAEPKMLAEWD